MSGFHFEPKSLIGKLPMAKGILAPKRGWEADTAYRVLVSFGGSNPIHESIVKIGFVDGKGKDKKPGNYSVIHNNTYEAPAPIESAYFLLPIEKLFTDGKFEEKKEGHEVFINSCIIEHRRHDPSFDISFECIAVDINTANELRRNLNEIMTTSKGVAKLTLR